MLFHTQGKAQAGCQKVGFGNICIVHGFASLEQKSRIEERQKKALCVKAFGSVKSASKA
jgi:hypothetical protein